MNATPPTEERVWAVISHLSSLAFGMGIILPIVGWSEQRRKSNYTSFQCLQALGYQSLGYTIWVLASAVIAIILAVIMVTNLSTAGGNVNNPDTFVRNWAIIFPVSIFSLLGIYSLLPIVAAVACALGKDFRYPILGNRLARYLKYDSTLGSAEAQWLEEEHGFRWVAAMGHFSILIFLWGMIAPLTTSILFGKRNAFLKFQSIQTLVYQAGTTMLCFVAFFLYLLGLMFLIGGLGANGEPHFNSSIGMIGIVIFGGALLIAALLILFVPLLHILGQWAGYRVLKGDNYSYPFVGRLVNKWISKHPIIEEKPI